MNLRNVLRAYSLLRQMSNEELAQLEIWRGATDAERALIVETLSDKPQKKSSKKAAGGSGGKSKRASLQQQMTSTLKPLADVINQPRCTTMIDDNGGEMECGETVDNNVHHKQTDPNYHEFQPPASSAAGSGG